VSESCANQRIRCYAATVTAKTNHRVNDIDQTTLRLFVRAANAGSFSQTAKAVGVDISTVTRAIAKLEGDLGTKLFFRATKGLTLTESGRLYHAHAQRALDEESRIRAAISDQSKHAGTLRISLPVFLAENVIPRVMPMLLANHSSAHFDIHASDDRVDFLTSTFDLAIRLGPLPHSSLHAKRIIEFRRLTCAAPKLLARSCHINHPDDLAKCSIVAYGNGPSPAKWSFCNANGESAHVQISPHLRSNNLALLLASAEQGLGIVRLPSWVAAPALARGTLVSILVDWQAARANEELALYGLHPSDPGKARLRNAFLAAVIEVTNSAHNFEANQTK
jgi:DNA-binding transcriptional LysR family regulator